MSTPIVSGAAISASIQSQTRVDVAMAAAAKAAKLQRQTAAEMVGLIEQASTGGDIGRIISVRA
jgi:hypothetical protein